MGCSSLLTAQNTFWEDSHSGSPEMLHNTIRRFVIKFTRTYQRTFSWSRWLQIWRGFDRASSLICGNKIPIRCNRGFYCRSYCLLNMFRASLCPSSGAQEYYTVVAACGIWCCGFQVAGLVWSWGLCVRFNQHPANRTHNPQVHTRPATWKTKARNTTGSSHCIIILSSWWWA